MQIARVEQSERAASVIGAGDAIERITPPTADEFRRRYVEPQRPVIIVGAIEAWPARRLWSAEYLSQRYGDRRVAVADVVEKRVADDPATGFAFRDEPLGACIERIRRGGDAGYAMFPLESLPQLEADLRTPDFAPPAPWSIRKLWL